MLVVLATSNNQQDDSRLDDIVIEETILSNILRLIKKDMPDNVKMLTQYFQFFILYSSNGRQRVKIFLKIKKLKTLI